MKISRLFKRKNKKDETEKFTYKIGSAVGNKLNVLFSNSIIRISFLIALYLFLFIFIAPIQNNIFTLIILAVLIIISYILKRLSKKNGKNK